MLVPYYKIYLEIIIFLAVAVFSLNQTSYTINEDDAILTICVDLISLITLDRDISLQLVFEDPVSSASDFNSTELSYVFSSGSNGSTSVCEEVSITQDLIVEDEEVFVIVLQGAQSDVNLTQNTAVIMLQDSPGNCEFSVFCRLVYV